MTKIRSSAGGAYSSRGRWYARVTVAPQKRVGVLLPWARPEDEALVHDRVRALQGMVSRLRQAGEQPWIEKVLEIGGPADVAKLAELAGYVEEIVVGKIVKVEQAKDSTVTFAKFAERWTSGELHE